MAAGWHAGSQIRRPLLGSHPLTTTTTLDHRRVAACRAAGHIPGTAEPGRMTWPDNATSPQPLSRPPSPRGGCYQGHVALVSPRPSHRRALFVCSGTETNLVQG